MRKLGLLEATSIGVGTMIGAGIFSILGVGAQICGRNFPLAFFLAALLAYLIAYSYAKLSSTFVSNAGPIEFVVRGMGDNVLTGSLAVLLWFSYVVSLSLFVKAFGGYFLALIGADITGVILSLVELGVISFFTALNFFGSKAVGRAEFWIVMVKVSILLVFVLLGVWSVNPEYVTPLLEPEAVKSTVYASTVLFLTYMGFGLITNASENIEDPERNVPRAIYLSLAVVAFIYISVSLTALGNLGADGLIAAKEYALAEAARPFLGSSGFVLVSLGALFSTASAINATLYGGANVSYALAKEGKLPDIFERKVWFRAPEGLYITAALSFTFALLFDLSGIANIISTVFLVIYVFVLLSHYRLADLTGGNRLLIIFSLMVILAVLATIMFYQWGSNRASFYTILGVVAGAMLLEAFYRKLSGREITERG
ncbi:APC family permease [Hydrogenivirga sp. 128-5-R1-1]|uniref:APC family permease n=1 Tax=Hydrogenivirga sp. 128-5-R1-1 TaxID=392423 RepID=UPI00015F16E8|nr:APC family permease [Hydrogenivirga sp. 128-5-R1-1]EDP76126.1 amino acid transporter [Hydrogenivirga sp. 128-5-R1-1]